MTDLIVKIQFKFDLLNFWSHCKNRTSFTLKMFTPLDLHLSQLPTRRCVIRYLLWIKRQSKSKKFGLSKFFNKVISVVQKLWRDAEIPTISKPGIRKKLENLCKNYRDVIKNPSHYPSHFYN